MLIEQLTPVRMPVSEQLDHIRRIQKTGDEESWRAIIRQFLPAIKRAATRSSRYDIHEVRESELLLRLFYSIRSFDPERGIRPVSYVYGMLGKPINHLRFVGPVNCPAAAWQTSPEDYERLLAPTVSLDTSETEVVIPVEDETDRDAIREETVLRVRSAVNQLPERERQLIQSRMAGQTLAEVGEKLEISGERVRQVESRAKKRLRDILEDPSFTVQEQPPMNNQSASAQIEQALKILKDPSAAEQIDKEIDELQARIEKLKTLKKVVAGGKSRSGRQYKPDPEMESKIVPLIESEGPMKCSAIAERLGVHHTKIGHVVAASGELARKGGKVVLAV